MKIKEVTNPEEQLGLLRVIIDNTWSAIKQQADSHARQKTAQSAPKAKVKPPKPAPYAPLPKSMPKPKPLYPSKPQYKPQAINPLNKSSYRTGQAISAPPKNSTNAMPAHSNTSLSNNEKDELINLPRGALPKPF